MRINPQFFARLMLLAFLSITILMFAGCRTKKVTVDKKEKTVSELKKNDIKTSEASKIETDILHWNKSKSITISPKDIAKPAKIIYKGDTISLDNATVEINQAEAKKKQTSKGSTERSTTDNSTEEKSAHKKEKSKNSKVQAASWGINIALIVGIVVFLVLVFIHFKTKGINPAE